MRYLTIIAIILTGLSGVNGLTASTAQAAVCPTTANTNSDCGFVITIGLGGTITGTSVSGASPYDGSDDALVGVVNNSGAVYNGSFTLSGTGNGGGIFGFDGDGICHYTGAAYCATTTYGYEGPLNTFTNISSDTTTGTVDFTGTGIADGATSYFSLEGSPASIAAGGGIGTPSSPSSVPEPTTFAILGAGLLALMSARRWNS